MATIQSSTIRMYHDTDARWRAEVQFVHDTFALGWVQTADTGQISPATTARPTASNQFVGYEMWRMDDALQATKPVFARVEYRSGGGSPNIFVLGITLGAGSDGSGNIVGPFRPILYVGGGNNMTNDMQCFGSAAADRITLAMGLTGAAAGQTMVFALERTRDSTGATTGAGLIMFRRDGAAGVGTDNYSQVIPFGAVAPTEEAGVQCILSTNNPTTYTGDQGVGLMIPMLGVAIQPGLNICVVMANDFASFAQVSFPLYGATHTWQHCGPLVSSLRATRVDTNTRLMIRFE